MGFRRDGNLKLFVLKPADEFDIPERRDAFWNMDNEFRSKLNEMGIKFTSGSDGRHYVNARDPWSYTPEIFATNKSNGELTKAYDTNEAIKDAIKNNDLVIAAGDSSNDTEMINPFTYMENYITKELEQKLGNKIKRFSSKGTAGVISLMQILDSEPELAKSFMKMPFVGIIVKRGDGEDKLSELYPLAEGKYKKIVIVEEGELQKGIKEAIKLYSEQNPKYAEKLSHDLKNEIRNEGGCPPSDDKKNNNIWKYVLGGLGIVVTAIGIYKLKGNKNDNTNQHSNKQQ